MKVGSLSSKPVPTTAQGPCGCTCPVSRSWWKMDGESCECQSVKVIRVLNQLYPKDPFVCPKISALTNQDSMERHTGFDHCFNWLSPPFSKSWFWLRQIIRLSITVPENQHETPTHLMGVSRTGFDYCSVGYLMIQCWMNKTDSKLAKLRDEMKSQRGVCVCVKMRKSPQNRLTWTWF